MANKIDPQFPLGKKFERFCKMKKKIRVGLMQKNWRTLYTSAKWVTDTQQKLCASWVNWEGNSAILIDWWRIYETS